MRIKKLNIALVFLAIALLVGVMEAAPVGAEVTFPLAEKATLSVEYLGPSENGSAPPLTPADGGVTPALENAIIWIGVAVTDSYKMTENFTQDGIYNMEIAFDYNSKYLEPCSNIAGNIGTLGDKESWLATLREHNLDSTAGALDAAFWNSGIYDFVDASCTMKGALNTDSHREKTPAAGDSMMFISLRATKASTEYRLKGSSSADENATKYLIRVPFYVNEVPEGGIDNNSLKLALGPQTFVLGSGTDGYSTYAAWEKTNKTTDEVNLKSYLDWEGDIVLFVPSSDEQLLTGITIFEYIDSTAGEGDSDPPVPREYDLYSDRKMTEANKGFAAGTETYYAAVDHDVKAITLRISPNVGTANVKVFFNDETTATPLTSNAENNYMDTGPMQTLKQVDPDVVDTETGTLDIHYGFNNTITVTAFGNKVYKIHVLRYLKPAIVLEYGNSPYGRIMKDTSLIVDGDDTQTASNRQDAKDDFDSTKQYPEPDPSDPDNVQNLKYAADEYDRDEYCYFKVLNLNDDNTKLENTALVDPGFSVFDSMGQPIDFTSEDSEITIERSIEVRLFSSSFYLQEGETGVTSATYTKTGTDVFTEFADNSKIVPDAYDMIYTMKDAEGNSTELGRRKIAVVYPRGDADLSGARNILDVNAVRNDVAETRLLNKLYLYFSRIPDQDISGALNILDVNAVRNDVAETKLFIEYYKN